VSRLLIVVSFIVSGFYSQAQSDTVIFRKPCRKILVGGLTGVTAGSSLVYLQTAWYSSYKTEAFHFFNDNAEWQQMDKAGHFFTSYQTSRLMMDAFEWAGFNRKTERWVGGSIGLVYLTAIEIMDGYSGGWGFSWGDESANIAGTALAIAQESLWNEQRLHIKFSYFPSGMAQFNPALLGSTPTTRLLKDYNSQAYWLSFGAPLFGIGEKKFPSWLLFSVGYSASGMTGGHGNIAPGTKNSDGNPITFERKRILLFSLDVDFTKIKTRSRFLKGLFSAVNVLKVPFPSISVSQSGVQGHWFR
jgi:hypothetical protein